MRAYMGQLNLQPAHTRSKAAQHGIARYGPQRPVVRPIPACFVGVVCFALAFQGHHRAQARRTVRDAVAATPDTLEAVLDTRRRSCYVRRRPRLARGPHEPQENGGASNNERECDRTASAARAAVSRGPGLVIVRICRRYALHPGGAVLSYRVAAKLLPSGDLAADCVFAPVHSGH